MQRSLVVTLDLTDWNIVGEALTQLPYNKVARLIDEINSQFKKQIAEESQNDVG